MKKRLFTFLLIMVFVILVLGGCRKQYTLNITVEGQGTVNPASGTKFPAETVVTLVPTPEDHWVFEEWDGADKNDVANDNGAWKIVMTSDRNLIARFTRLDYNLTVNTAGTGSGSVSQQIKAAPKTVTTYPKGQTVILTAIPESGSRFDHWEGDIDPEQADDSSIEIAIDSDKTITAYFALLVVPSAPSGLAATGSLRKITLQWDASTTEGVTAYNIYRSTDGTTFSQRATVTAPDTSCDDTIDSPAGDGVFYYYRVTAVGDCESSASNTVRSMHGTRLAASYTSGFTTQSTGSPYVAEGTTIVDGGSFIVAVSTKLYVLDNSVISIEAGLGRYFQVNTGGLLRVLASSGATHATITSHKTGGLGDGEGFYLYLYNVIAYDPADGSGTLIQFTQFSNLLGVYLSGTRIKFDNVKINANKSNGTTYFNITSNASPIIRNCLFYKMALHVSVDLRSTISEVKWNTFSGGYYSLYLSGLNNPGVNPGQIEQNMFDGTRNLYLFNMTGDTDVPLGNNYWHGGTGTPPLPNVTKGGTTTTVNVDFTNPSATLSSAPAGVGPNW